MENRILDYKSISAEEICNTEKYSNDDFITWQRVNKTVVPQKPSFLNKYKSEEEFADVVRRAAGLPKER